MKSERVRESCTVRVNGELRAVAPRTRILSLVQELTVGEAQETVGAMRQEPVGGVQFDGIAVALNGEVVPRAEWSRKELRDGDAVEIVRAVQGG